MTLYEFKQELYIVRDNRRVMRSLRTSLANLEEDILTSVFSGAIDYSKEKVQHQSDPDSAIINAIMLTEKEKERLRKQLQELQDENAELEQLIYRQRVWRYDRETKASRSAAWYACRVGSLTLPTGQKIRTIKYTNAPEFHALKAVVLDIHPLERSRIFYPLKRDEKTAYYIDKNIPEFTNEL